jgi:hypothetical protein
VRLDLARKWKRAQATIESEEGRAFDEENMERTPELRFWRLFVVGLVALK